MTENDISYQIRGAAFDVNNELGPGLLESVYEAAMFDVLREKGLAVSKQVKVPVKFREREIADGLRLDLLVERRVIIEIKSVETLAPVHFKQILTYLKLTGIKLGLLINFNEHPIRIERLVNGL